MRNFLSDKCVGLKPSGIRKYFDVVFTEEEPIAEPVKEAAQEVQIPVYKTQEELQKEQEEQKKAEDARLLMEVISEVF